MQTEMRKWMVQVEVGHDGEGSHAAWHLAWVRVTNLDTGETATFECNRSPLLVSQSSHSVPSNAVMQIAQD